MSCRRQLTYWYLTGLTSKEPFIHLEFTTFQPCATSIFYFYNITIFRCAQVFFHTILTICIFRQSFYYTPMSKYDHYLLSIILSISQSVFRISLFSSAGALSKYQHAHQRRKDAHTIESNNNNNSYNLIYRLSPLCLTHKHSHTDVLFRSASLPGPPQGATSQVCFSCICSIREEQASLVCRPCRVLGPLNPHSQPPAAPSGPEPQTQQITETKTRASIPNAQIFTLQKHNYANARNHLPFQFWFNAAF